MSLDDLDALNDLLAFHLRLGRDRERGEIRPLAAYLQGVEEPARQVRLAAEYLELVPAGSTREGAGQGDAASVSGDHVGHRYEILEELAEGGQATVYLARDTSLGRRVALKVFPPSFGPRSSHALARARREARVTAHLEHPGICPIYDVGQREGSWFIAMRFVEGESLARTLARARERAGDERCADHERVRWAVHLVEQVARALHEAHEHGVIHRDIKPANIMLEKGGGPVLVDFGLAREEDSGERLSRTGAILGTRPYMAPEQLNGQPLDRGADIWSLGVVLYECLTLRRPFEGPTDSALDRAIQNESPSPPRRFNAAVERNLGIILETALRKEPGRRYRSALDLAGDLRRHAQGEPIRARPTPALAKLWLWSRRNPLVATLALALFLALVGGIVAVGSQYLRAEDHARRAIESAALARKEQRRAAADEARARRAQAEAYFGNARFAAQRGRWAVALEAYDRALAAGYEDEVEIAIGKIEALEGSMHVAEAVGLLEELCARGDLGSHRAKVLLLEADLAVDRIADPYAKLDLVREALKLQEETAGAALAPADEAFARALISTSAAEALEHLAQARRFDTYNRRVNSMLAILLLGMGRMEEAERFAAALTSQYPDDPLALVYSLAVLGLRQGHQAVEARLAASGRTLEGESRRVVRLLLDSLGLLESLQEIQEDLIFDGGVGSSWKLLSKLFLSSLRGRRKHARRGGELFFAFPPVLVRHYKAILEAAKGLPFSLAKLEEVQRCLDEAAADLGEGMFHHFAGILRLIRKDLPGAEASFARAAVCPSAFLRPPLALFYLLETRRKRTLDPALQRDPGLEAELRRRQAATIAKILDTVPLDARMFPVLHRAALDAGAGTLGAEILRRWLRSQPASLEAELWRKFILFF